MTESNSNGKTDPGTIESRVLEVRDWPDLSLRRWGEWGFSAGEVYRAAKYNFLVQPVRSTLTEVSGPESAFVLEGRWCNVDRSVEGRLGKLSIVVYVFLLVLFVGALYLIRMGSGISGLVLFAIMYIATEGFLPLSMRLIAPDRMAEKIEIPWSSLRRVILAPRLDVLLLGWGEDDLRRAVAVRFHTGMARKAYERLEAALGESIPVSEADSASLARPPGGMK